MDSPLATDSPPTPGPSLKVPDCPALVARMGEGILVSPEGEVDELTAAQALQRLETVPLIVCHAGFTLRRLGAPRPARHPATLDLLELFAFVRPAQFCVPTPQGLARALSLSPPTSTEDEALSLHDSTGILLGELQSPEYPSRTATRRLAEDMLRTRWSWAPYVIAALGAVTAPQTSGPRVAGIEIWTDLPEWEERAPRGQPDSLPVGGDEARAALQAILGEGAEERTAQSDFTALAAQSFAPCDTPGAPNIVLAEAPTGIGKTAAYIAPAGLWAQRNHGTVWISTYTKNLQRQVDRELDRLYTRPEDKASKAVVRKGRENYLCLLNFEEAVTRSELGAGRPGPDSVALGLLARWARHTRDGDMVGGDFPAWLFASSAASLAGLTDKRGECLYSACTHYKKCFIERSVRKARHADIVVANHALVMVQAALEHNIDSTKTKTAEDTPDGQFTRLIFDEGHHLFDAADSAFSAHLTAREAAELRRWIRGTETRRARRGRGLKERIGDLVEDMPEAVEALDAAVRAASALPSFTWARELGLGVKSAEQDDLPTGRSPALRFFAAIRDQVLARNSDGPAHYSQEAHIQPLASGLPDIADEWHAALKHIQKPLVELARILHRKLDDEAANLDSSLRARIEAAHRGLLRRAHVTIGAWLSMLDAMHDVTPADFVDWFAIDRFDGRAIDIGMHRHWVDPTIPFAEAVLETSQGTLITSATLRDHPPDVPDNWQSAEWRTGANHLAVPVTRASFPSPFNYAANARVFIVRDVNRNDMDAVASAFRELFIAAGGGALGLFTAIQRLQAVHARIVGPLAATGIPLYGQHIDAMDTGTLVDIFREETKSCLLGTDAVRDGVDVPGPSLRLLAFERVPWPRPDIVHQARREHFGKKGYDDMVTRMRLKQAFGRLLRRADDKGVFVMLDARTPTRLLTAFPEAVPITRLGLADAITEIEAFLNEPPISAS